MTNCLIFESAYPEEYLKASMVVDLYTDEVIGLSNKICKGLSGDIEIVRAVYYYMQENIPHSFSINAKEVTCKASEVVRYGHGICYAKANLLAAILRLNKIPAGFCYQRFIMDDSDLSRFVLHGFNAVYLGSIGKWIQVDIRNKFEGVDPEFDISKASGVVPVRKDMGETDYPYVLIEPYSRTIEALINNKDLKSLENGLPDRIDVPF
jgi:transglutaminase-like putative cysteine protease